MAPVRAFPQGPQRQLPKTVAPFLNETVLSYVARLAHANHLATAQLRRYVAGTAHGHPYPDWLAVAAGQPERVLRARLRGFAANERTYLNQTTSFRPLCRLCMARRGIHEPVYCTLAPHITACQRHQLWIGPLVHTLDDQKSLYHHPRVLVAARVHARLVHRYGDSDMRFTLRQARHFLSYWANAEQSVTNPFEQTSLSANIAVYPDIVAIGATLATHRQQIELQTNGRRTGWPLALIEEINERTGQAHTDITPVEQWVHNQRHIAAHRSSTAGRVNSAQGHQRVRNRSVKHVHTAAI
ncbi:TniQ family protein [Mycobacteroides abscessus]|uniref:TniQ family protein n=1 Tax=Mycobacteroides abscessus TaxID=36809 RepID=UPI00078CF2C1|nr:TniQ family protein [Mycobacteroides abscessus]AMU75472.1 hypothetical protein A3O06_13145 [Mycobacteroides abscessus]ANO24416.1 hypothetical protein BAB79_13135 [Mycobacteroides abscessus]MBN7321814.1 TniQ family protein [Mycobacteroides abscessus subsp. massiliense]